MEPIDVFAGLNTEQAEAVRVIDGPALVIAGAGTGKTRTLIHRLVHLVQSGVPPQNVLLLTFTRRAANEMIDRAMEMLGRSDVPLSGGTFHSFAMNCLRKFGDSINLSLNFTILDQSDSLQIITKLRGELELDEPKSFPKRNTIASILSKAVNKQKSIPDIVAEEYPHLLATMDAMSTLGRQYATYKSQHCMVDFDDLLVLLIRCLELDEDARVLVQRRFPYIMVDEYQDTNVLQGRIVELIAGKAGNVMVVGDDAQSIYAFRGARSENMFEYEDMFEGVKRIVLDRNYRSTQPILDLSNCLLDQMSKSFRKDLHTDQSEGIIPQLITAPEQRGENLFVCAQIRQLLRAGEEPGEIAVLVRSGRNSYGLEVELSRHKISFSKFGGFKFSESAHIKDALAFLRVFASPTDEVSLHRVLLLLDGVGPAAATKISRRLDGALDLDILRAAGSKRTTEPLRELAALFTLMQDKERNDVGGLFQLILEHYQPYLKQHFDDWPKRERDLSELSVLMGQQDDLQQFLTDMALEPPDRADGRGLKRTSSPDDIVISTIHSAKGLEWKHVFVMRVNDGVMPMIRRDQTSREDLDEDLRLLYVATTRAKEQLILTWPLFNEQQMPNEASRFLHSVPTTCLKRHRLPAARTHTQRRPARDFTSWDFD